MSRIHTHYDNLKVARNAPPEVIRAAYKTLSQKFHPDRNPDKPNATRNFQLINQAYEVLSNSTRRRAHDDWIAAEEAKQRAAPAPRESAHPFTDTRRRASATMLRPTASRAWKARDHDSGFRAFPAVRREWFSLNNLFKYFFWLLLPTLILLIAVAV